MCLESHPVLFDAEIISCRAFRQDITDSPFIVAHECPAIARPHDNDADRAHLGQYFDELLRVSLPSSSVCLLRGTDHLVGSRQLYKGHPAKGNSRGQHSTDRDSVSIGLAKEGQNPDIAWLAIASLQPRRQTKQAPRGDKQVRVGARQGREDEEHIERVSESRDLGVARNRHERRCDVGAVVLHPAEARDAFILSVNVEGGEQAAERVCGGGEEGEVDGGELDRLADEVWPGVCSCVLFRVGPSCFEGRGGDNLDADVGESRDRDGYAGEKSRWLVT